MRTKRNRFILTEVCWGKPAKAEQQAQTAGIASDTDWFSESEIHA